jgi:RND superfamily putative drug exporter
VIVSMGALYLVGDVVFSSLATGSVLVVLVAVVSSLTVLPALLAKLGRWVDRPRVPLLGRLSAKEGREGRLWPVLLRPAMRHPKATLLVSLVLMVGLALPGLDLKLSLPGNDGLPKDVAEMQTYDRMTAAFPGERAQHVVVVHTEAGRTAEVAEAMADLTRRTNSDPLFANSTPPRVVTSADGQTNKIRFGIPHAVESPESLQSLRELRERLVPATVGKVPTAEVAVTGDIARNVDTVEHQMDRLPWVVGFVLLITFLVMVAAFGSVVVALVAVLLNLLAAATTFGVLVLVFQYGFGESLLDFTSGGFIVSRVPLFLFVILFGLSMDYHVFVVSRIKEAVVGGKSTRDAVHQGITTSAGVVTSAALVMVSVFASFVFTSLLEMKQLGFGLAVAVLLDAFVIRIMILPALLTLLGPASWWPSKPGKRTGAITQNERMVPQPSARVGG